MPDVNGTDGIGYYRYEGFALQQKIAWIQRGRGSAALVEAQAALADLGSDLIESEQALRDLVTSLGGTWEGTAGAAAGAAMTAAAAWSADSAPAAQQAGTQVTLQTESVERTKYGMPEAEPWPEYGILDAVGDSFNARTGNLFDVQTDFDDQVARRRAADAEANRLLYEHERSSRANLAGLPVLGEVPKITVTAEPPATDCLPVVPENDHVAPPPEVRTDDDGGEDRTEVRKSTDEEERPTDEETRPTTEEERPNGAAGEPDGSAEPKADAKEQPKGDVVDGTPAGSPVRQPPGEFPAETRQDGQVTTSGFVPEERPQASSGARPSLPAPGPGGFSGGVGGVFSSPDPAGSISRSAPRGPGEAVATRLQPAAGRGGPVGGPAAARSGGSLLHPAAAGRGEGDEDAEHSDRYHLDSDELFRTDDILVLRHSVIGEEIVE